MNRRRRTSNDASSNSTTLMIFLEKKKKKKKKKTHYNSAAEGVQVFGKFVVVIEVNEREFFQRSSVYSWKCGKCKCERRENARAHFWRFQNFSFFLRRSTT